MGEHSEGVERREPPLREVTTGEDTPEQANSCRQVKINKVANGFVLKIGCQTLVAKTWEEASKGLAEFWEDSAAAEKKYVKN